MSENLEIIESPDIVDYWARLRETCENNQKLIHEKCKGNEDFNEDDKRNFKMEFIKEQLGKNKFCIDFLMAQFFKF